MFKRNNSIIDEYLLSVSSSVIFSLCHKAFQRVVGSEITSIVKHSNQYFVQVGHYVQSKYLDYITITTIT